MKTTTKLSPLAILIIATLAVGGVLAAWYWSSQPITSTYISVTGWITAKASVDPRTVWNGEVKHSYADLNETYILLNGVDVGLEAGKQYLFIIVDSTNAETLNLSLSCTVPAGMVVSANLQYEAVKADGMWSTSDMTLASDIKLDGSEVYSLELLGNPLYACSNGLTDYVLFVVVEFDISAGSLGIGSYAISDIVVSLGDSL